MDAGHGIIWDRPERAARGPAPSLSREEIATAAVELADTRGIEAVSMRSLAVELGVGATSLYRYVDRKDELIELMVDAVMGSDLQFEVLGEWRDDLRSFAHGLRAMTLRHPWMVVPSAGLRNFGPKTARCYEQILSAIDGLGLEIDEMLVMVETLDAFVRGRALEELSEQEAVRRSGLDQEQYIESLIGSGRYPLLTRVVFDARAPHDPDRLEHGFDLGLERVLDGLAMMLPASGPVQPVPVSPSGSPEPVKDSGGTGEVLGDLRSER
jgi:AcrR family transcriptional regulator